MLRFLGGYKNVKKKIMKISTFACYLCSLAEKPLLSSDMHKLKVANYSSEVLLPKQGTFFTPLSARINTFMGWRNENVYFRLITLGLMDLYSSHIWQTCIESLWCMNSHFVQSKLHLTFSLYCIYQMYFFDRVFMH